MRSGGHLHIAQVIRDLGKAIRPVSTNMFSDSCGNSMEEYFYLIYRFLCASTAFCAPTYIIYKVRHTFPQSLLDIVVLVFVHQKYLIFRVFSEYKAEYFRV